MTNPMPPLDFTAAPANPAGYGLYDAATAVSTSEVRRITAGVDIWPVNCSEAYGTWPADPCADPQGTKEGDRPGPQPTFNAVVPWAYDECGPGTTQQESQARAMQTLRLRERLLVESAFATRILADAAVLPGVATLEDAIGSLEEYLGEQGYVGYIHAAARWAAEASQYRWTNQTGAVLRTPLGHGWVFGGGYASVLGDTLVATGPLYLWRAPEVVNTSFDQRYNLWATVAERAVVVGYECAVAAVTITEAP